MKSVKSIEEIRRKELSSIVDICTKPWETAVEPVQVAPHVYYAGNSWVGVFWIATKDGIILLDAGMPFQLYIIFEGMRKLGFNPKDIRIALCSHAHYDHCGAMKAVLEYTGAVSYGSRKDIQGFEDGRNLVSCNFDYQGFTPAKFYEDSGTIELGDMRIKAVVNGGHTLGTTCFFLLDRDTDGTSYRVGIHGGLGFSRLADCFFEDRESADKSRRNYIKAQETVIDEPVDIALSFHTYNTNMLKRLEGRDWKALVDENEWKSMIKKRLDSFQAMLDLSRFKQED